MRKISEVYSYYKIMPQLQMHQLRVAAVAKTICDSIDAPVDTRSVIAACLLHDMGNILKSNFVIFPELCPAEGPAYWGKVKEEAIAKYGADEHDMTKAIASELNIPSTAMECLNAVGFSKAIMNRQATSYEHKICCYSDQRAGPHGILPLSERLMDAKARRIKSGRKVGPEFDILLSALEEIEMQIFSRCKISPGQITDDTLVATIEELRSFEI